MNIISLEHYTDNNTTLVPHDYIITAVNKTQFFFSLINATNTFFQTSKLHVAWGSSHRWIGVFSVSSHFIVIVKTVTPCFTGLAFLAGP